MIKYCFIVNEQTGLCNIAIGNNEAYYKLIGMEQRDVQQSDIDLNWYLTEKCPMKPDEQKLAEAKQAKYEEANKKAVLYLEGGNALYELAEGKHIEATDGNIAKFTAYALAFVTGQLQPSDTVIWNTKEDENIELTQEQVAQVLNGLGQVQAHVWAVKYPAYLALINAAQTVEAVEAIIIDYSTETEGA